MTATSLQHRDDQQQLWLDVSRPVQPRPRRKRDAAAGAPQPPAAPGHSQFELHMIPRPVATPARTAFQVKAQATEAPDAPVAGGATRSAGRSFAAWLVNQGKQPGSLGELARAVRLDRLFPKSGTADDVRARFSAAGADGDAFAALDDAEREFDRLG